MGKIYHISLSGCTGACLIKLAFKQKKVWSKRMIINMSRSKTKKRGVPSPKSRKKSNIHQFEFFFFWKYSKLKSMTWLIEGFLKVAGRFYATTILDDFQLSNVNNFLFHRIGVFLSYSIHFWGSNTLRVWISRDSEPSLRVFTLRFYSHLVE